MQQSVIGRSLTLLTSLPSKAFLTLRTTSMWSANAKVDNLECTNVSFICTSNDPTIMKVFKLVHENA